MKNTGEIGNIFSVYDSESPLATEFRRIYNNLKRFCNSSGNTFLITSANRGEGKSTITSHLALTIAQLKKKKVLVIDADIRRPRLHKVFDVDKQFGLCECLKDYVDPMKVIKKTQQENLYVITAGGRTESPSSLFEAETVSGVFDKIKFYFDIVIVDSAPVLAVSDTLFLCAEVNKVILVVLAGVTARELVIRANDILMESNADVLGVVLNNTMEVLPYYYDYRYYEQDSSIEI